jgi:hypothetical protein
MNKSIPRIAPILFVFSEALLQPLPIEALNSNHSKGRRRADKTAVQQPHLKKSTPRKGQILLVLAVSLHPKLNCFDICLVLSCYISATAEVSILDQRSIMANQDNNHDPPAAAFTYEIVVLLEETLLEKHCFTIPNEIPGLNDSPIS